MAHHHHPERRQPEAFHAMLASMAEQPSLYFASHSSLLRALETYLHGYENAAALFGGPSLDLGLPFCKWLVYGRTMKGSIALSWSEILLMNYPTDEAAYAAFFSLFAEFHETVVGEA